MERGGMGKAKATMEGRLGPGGVSEIGGTNTHCFVSSLSSRAQSTCMDQHRFASMIQVA